jgi:hypothetical protein
MRKKELDTPLPSTDSKNDAKTRLSQDDIEDITLLLIYLQSWEEEPVKDIKVTRAWKGYDFAILDRLSEKGFIDSKRGNKSL